MGETRVSPRTLQNVKQLSAACVGRPCCQQLPVPHTIPQLPWKGLCATGIPGATVGLHRLGDLLGEHRSSHCPGLSMGHTFHLFASSSATHSLRFPNPCSPTPCKNEATAGVFEADPTILHLAFVNGIYGSPKANREIICIGKGQASSTSSLLAPQIPLKQTPH